MLKYVWCDTQLGMAFTVYSALLWTAMDVLSKTPAAIASSAELTPGVVSTLRSLRPVAAVTALVVAATVASGAFVAGNDAGHAYNDWPLFAGRVIPELLWEDKVCAVVLLGYVCLFGYRDSSVCEKDRRCRKRETHAT